MKVTFSVASLKEMYLATKTATASLNQEMDLLSKEVDVIDPNESAKDKADRLELEARRAARRAKNSAKTFEESLRNMIMAIDTLKHFNYVINGTEVTFEMDDIIVMKYIPLVTKVCMHLLPIAKSLLTFKAFYKKEIDAFAKFIIEPKTKAPAEADSAKE